MTIIITQAQTQEKLMPKQFRLIKIIVVTVPY